MKNYLLLVLVCINLMVYAQVTFKIDSLPEYTPSEDILYVAGDFTNWNPGLPEFALSKDDNNTWTITLDSVAEGTTYHFKFTRGDWGNVEKGLNGEEISDRSFTFGNGDNVGITIFNWADYGEPPESTASWNVQVMDEEFYMPQLDRSRRIWLYLPPGYDSTDMRYPVLYMHDGQNLFDVLTSFAGEWEVDETLNELADQGYKVPIVVGIDNGGVHRFDELTPWPVPQYGGGQGNEYMEFVVETLKPYIDAQYRTIKDRDNTGIAGSSLGGLISTYGAMKYQDVFSKSGPFSPAYWVNHDSLLQFVSEKGIQHDIRFYQNIGQQEGDQYIDMMYEMEDSLKSVGFENVSSKVIPGAGHTEATWRDDFAPAYLYLFVSYANDVFAKTQVKPLLVSPNPATSKIRINCPENETIILITVIDTGGKIVLRKRNLRSNEINVSNLETGVYIIKVSASEGQYIGRFVKR